MDLKKLVHFHVVFPNDLMGIRFDLLIFHHALGLFCVWGDHRVSAAHARPFGCYDAIFGHVVLTYDRTSRFRMSG
jgi:hypothetical protein